MTRCLCSLPWAVRTFDLLEAGWDDHYGGYFDHYNLPHDHPENQFKQTGTNFHALQALTELYESTDDETHRRRRLRRSEIYRRQNPF